MPDEARHSRNAPGPFYVVSDACMTCDAPRVVASDLIDQDDESGCFFRKQPRTPSEVDASVRAMYASCISSYRYGGEDPKIRLRLAEAGLSTQCDFPWPDASLVLRRYVRCSYDGAESALELARKLGGWFHDEFTRGAVTEPVEEEDSLATFYFSSDREHAPALRFAVKRLRAVPSVAAENLEKGAAPYRAMASRPRPSSWLIAQLEGEHIPVWIHDALLKHGSEELRWFSVDEWHAEASGREVPV